MIDLLLRKLLAPQLRELLALQQRIKEAYAELKQALWEEEEEERKRREEEKREQEEPVRILSYYTRKLAEDGTGGIRFRMITPPNSTGRAELKELRKMVATLDDILASGKELSWGSVGEIRQLIKRAKQLLKQAEELKEQRRREEEIRRYGKH